MAKKMVVISKTEYDRLIENQLKLAKIEKRLKVPSSIDPALLTTIKLNEELEEKIRHSEEKKRKKNSTKEKKEKETQTGTAQTEEDPNESLTSQSVRTGADESYLSNQTNQTGPEEGGASGGGGEEEEEEDERYYLSSENLEEDLGEEGDAKQIEENKNTDILIGKFQKYFDPKIIKKGTNLINEIINIRGVSIHEADQVVHIAQTQIDFYIFLEFIKLCFSKSRIPEKFQYLIQFLKDHKLSPLLVQNPNVKKELEVRTIGAQAASPKMKSPKGGLSKWFGSLSDVPGDDE